MGLLRAAEASEEYGTAAIFAFLTFAVIAVGDWRSAKAVGQRVPERDLVGMQGQGRPHRLARIFTAASPAATTDAACSVKPGGGPAKNRKNPTARSDSS